MAQFKELYSVVTVDNKKLLCSIDQWAKTRLSGNDLVQFEQDFANFITWFDGEIAAGRADLQPIVTSVPTQRASMEVTIGITFSLLDSELSNPLLTALAPWHQRRLQDPQVVAVPVERIN